MHTQNLFKRKLARSESITAIRQILEIYGGLSRSANGWLGGLGFGASASQLKNRDQWIRRDGEGRQKHLHRNIGLSRFLIRPMVACHNLASRVLGMAARQLPDDVETRCGYRPWLVETFVESARYRGTCYRAANWIEVGQTLGRGRQDRDNRYAESHVIVLDLTPFSLDSLEPGGHNAAIITAKRGLNAGFHSGIEGSFIQIHQPGAYRARF